MVCHNWSCYYNLLGESSNHGQCCDAICRSRFNTFAYIRIYFVVKNMHFSNDGIGDCSTEENSSKMRDKRKSLREKNLAQSCAMVVLISYFSFIPFTFCFFYFENDYINLRIATCWTWNLVTLNSGLNSLVFFWKRPLLRQEALDVLKKMSRE